MDAVNARVGEFYRRVATLAVVIQVVSGLTLLGFVWGTIALVLRLTSSTSTPSLLWGLIAVPLVIGFSIWIARRGLPDRSAIRAYLDHVAGCGGMLMAGSERDLGRWTDRLPGTLPTVEWRGTKPIGRLGVAVAYLLLCMLLPIEQNPLFASGRLDVGRETDRLAAQVKVLKEEKILDSARAENLKQKLQQVRDQAAGTDPARTLEALDHLKDVVRQEARKAAESASREAGTLGKLETAAQAVQQAIPELDEKQSTELMKNLGSMAKKSVEESESLNEELDPELAADVAGGKLSPNEAGKLADAAAAARGKIKRKAKKLHDNKLIDNEQLGKCDGKSECDSKPLADFLKKNGCKTVTIEDAMGSLSGKGGTDDDGPGITPLDFSGDSTAEGAKFKEVTLPPGDLSALKDGRTTGVSRTAPTREPQSGAPTAGGLSAAEAGGGSANAAVVLPRHKAAVGRYFDRDKK